MKPLVIIVIAVVCSVVTVLGVLVVIDTYHQAEYDKKMMNQYQKNMENQRIVDAYELKQQKIDEWFDCSSAVTLEQLQQCWDSHHEPARDFAGCIYDVEKGRQYFIDRYYEEQPYRDWFDERFFPMTIIEAVDYAESKTPKELITTEWLTNAEYYSTECDD
jgi:hypothetical protein